MLKARLIFYSSSMRVAYCILPLQDDLKVTFCRPKYPFWTKRMVETLTSFRIWKTTETAAQKCSVRKVFLKIQQNSQENTCARVCNFNKKETLADALFNYPYFIEHLRDRKSSFSNNRDKLVKLDKLLQLNKLNKMDKLVELVKLEIN